MLQMNFCFSSNKTLTCCCLLLQGYPAGFPVLMVNRLSSIRSARLLQYLIDGNYLDKRTKQLVAELLTYNPDLHVLAYSKMTFDWLSDGSIAGQLGATQH